MKIVCSACGKKYEPLRSQGICPYCGMHTSDVQLAEAVREAEEAPVKGDSLKDILKSYLNNKLKKEQKLSPLRKKGVQLVICLILVGCMAGAGFWGYKKYEERLEYYRSQRDTSDLKTEQYTLGDSVVIGGVSVRITRCRAVPEYQSKLEGGFKVIEVTYEESGKAEYSKLSDAFICTAGGCTAKALDRFDIMDLEGITEEEFRNSDFTEGVLSDEGRESSTHRMLFAVPESETTHTLYLFRSTDPYARDKTTELRCEFTLGEEAAE